MVESLLLQKTREGSVLAGVGTLQPRAVPGVRPPVNSTRHRNYQGNAGKGLVAVAGFLRGFLQKPAYEKDRNRYYACIAVRAVLPAKPLHRCAGQIYHRHVSHSPGAVALDGLCYPQIRQAIRQNLRRAFL